jgi:hypothetical protein
MTLTRRNRLATVLFALLSLLFMQLAVAGYVCPGGLTKVVEVTAVATMAQADMPCANAMSMSIAMDDEQASLCHVHCQSDPQSAGHYQLPGWAGPVNSTFSVLLPRIVPALLGAPLQTTLLRRTTAPPLAVRNCCFRI